MAYLQSKFNCGGGTGIRTLEPLVGVTRSPSVRLQPLGHPTIRLVRLSETSLMVNHLLFLKRIEEALPSLFPLLVHAPATVAHEFGPERRRYGECENGE